MRHLVASNFVNPTFRRRLRRTLSLITAISLVFQLSGLGVTLRPLAASAASPYSNPAANLDQCRNGSASSPADCLDLGGSLGWVNGNANATQAHYVEGYSIPYRVVMTDLPTDGTPVTLTLGYDIKHSDKHAIDYLTSFDRLEPHVMFGHSAEAIDPVSGTGLSGPADDTHSIPAPSSAGSPVPGQPTASFNALPASERVMSIWNGDLTDISYDTQGSLTHNQSETTIDVTFVPSDSTAVLSWGGHIASRFDWGNGNSAGGIEGSPYHMRLDDWSLNNLGNQDRSLMAGAVIRPSTMTIVKQADPEGDQAFSFDGDLGPFSLTDDGTAANTQTVENLIVFDTYTVTETVPAGWTLESIVCDDPTENSDGDATTATATIELDEAEDVTCTFTNSADTGTITIRKKVDTDGDGVFESGDLTANALGFDWGLDGETPARDMGTSATVPSGSHSVTEDMVPGYHFVGWYPTGSPSNSCTNPLSTNPTINFTLTKNGTIDKTFCNARDTGNLTVIKQDADGNRQPNVEFEIAGSQYFTDQNGEIHRQGLPTGDYAVREVAPPPGFSFSTVSGVRCTNANPSTATVVFDQTTTCTFTNSRDTGTIEGTKFNDRNGNGVRDEGEPGLPGWTIQLSSGASTLTDAFGHYQFNLVPTGTYSVNEVLQTGWTNTTPNPVANVVVTANRTTTVNFGNFRKVSVTACKVEDADGDLETTADQTPIHGWTVQLSVDGEIEDSQLTGEDGCFTWTNLGPGVSYDVAEVVPPGWTALTPLSHDFGLAQSGRTYSLTFANFENVDVTVCKRVDLNGDRVVSLDPVYTQGWRMSLQPGEGSPIEQTTGLNGCTTFANLGPNGYTIAEEHKDGWIQTFPHDGQHSFRAASGFDLTFDFGNFQLGHISGTKLDDVGKPLPSWQICLTGGSLLSPVCTTTDQNGGYAFANLTAGTYTVSETLQFGWTQLSPTAPGTHSVLITSGTNATNRNFGNRPNAFDLVIDKVAPATVEAGAQLTFTLNWSVSGNIPIQNVTLTDPLPVNTTFVSASDGGSYNPGTNSITWSLGTKNPGDAGTVSLTVAVGSPLAKGTLITNSAQLCGSGDLAVSQTPGPTTKCDDDATTTTVNSLPVLGLTKTDSPDPVPAGQLINYTVSWSVSGNAVATNVVITDPIPANTTFVSVADGGSYQAATNTVSWNLGSQAPGASGAVHFTVRAVSPIANGTVVTNTASIDSAETDPAITATATTTITSAPILSITKTENVETFLNPGQTVLYTIVVTNAASATDTAHAVTVTDALPTGLTFEDGTTTKTAGPFELAPGASQTITANAVVSATTVAGNYANTATAKGTNTPEVTATATIEVRVPVVLATTSLGITKAVDRSVVNRGQTVVYTVEVTNTGQATAENVVLTDRLPEGLTFAEGGGREKTIAIGNLTPGQSFLMTYTVRVDQDARVGTYDNQATATADNADPVTAQARVKVRTVKVLAKTGAGPLEYFLFFLGWLAVALGTIGIRWSRHRVVWRGR